MSGSMILLDLLASGFLDLYVRLASMAIVPALGAAVYMTFWIGAHRA